MVNNNFARANAADSCPIHDELSGTTFSARSKLGSSYISLSDPTRPHRTDTGKKQKTFSTLEVDYFLTVNFYRTRRTT